MHILIDVAEQKSCCRCAVWRCRLFAVIDF